MKSIRIGIVGTGDISSRLVDAASRTDRVEIAAVCSRKVDTGRAFAEKHGIERVYSSYPDMLSDVNLDALYVASPIFMHKEHSLKAISAGKHVLCEKAIAVNYAEFSEMKRAAIDKGRVLLEAMRPRFDGSVELLRENLHLVGNIRRASFVFCKYSSRYDDFKRGIVRNAFDPGIKNSALTDIGIYPLSICISLFGLPSIVSSQSVFLSNGFEGAGEARLIYPDFSAQIKYSKIENGEPCSVIEGERGSLLVYSVNAPQRIVFKSGGEEHDLPFSPKENNMEDELAAFRDMVLGERSWLSALEDTDKTMQVIDSIYASSGIAF